MTTIELPDSVTSMGLNLFADCKPLKNIQVSPEQPVFAVIDGVLFNKAEKSLICYPAGKQEEAYEVPQGIQQIKSDAFSDCSALTTIELPDSVTTIGESAGCESLYFLEQHVFAVIEVPDRSGWKTGGSL
ncbi:MAG: leucine-rich repeat protein [Christensenellales bacterium]